MKLATILIIGLLIFTMVACSSEISKDETLNEKELETQIEDSLDDELIQNDSSVDIGDMI